MSAPTIAGRVRQVIAGQFGKTVDDITDVTTFADLGADSLDVVEATLLLEQEFDITLDEDHVETLADVGQVIKYVENRYGRR